MLFREKKSNSEQSLTHFDSQAKFVLIRLFSKNQNIQVWGKPNISDTQKKKMLLGSNPRFTSY